MRVADAVVQFVGNYTEVDAGLGLIPGKAAPIAKKVGALFSTNVAGGLVAGGAAMTTVGALLVAASEPIEKAQALLRAAVESTGKAFDETYKKKVEDAIKIQERYGHGAADTQQALAKLTIGFKDPQKALEELHRAEELAAMKGISLADAASLLVRTHAGATKALKDFGINIKDSTTLLADAAKADKAYQVDLGAHEKAVASLSALEARDAGVKKLSVAQQQQLAAAHKAVTDSATKLAAATDAKAKAEAAAHGVTKNGEVIFNKLIDNYHGAERASDTFGGRLLSLKTRVGDFAGEWGGKAGPVLAAAGPLLMTVGGIVQLVTTFTGAHTAATAVDTAATEANTSVGLLARVGMAAGAVVTGVLTAAQWALNVALNANPIGLVVIAIAALVGGAILAYQHIGWFRDIVNAAWKEIGVLWGWISGNLIPIFGKLFGLLENTPLGMVLTHLSQIKDAAMAVWGALQGFGDFIGGVFTSVLNKITGPLGKVGDALNALNPFAKHSPSLVENVILGTDIIKGRYTALSGMTLVGPQLGGMSGGMPSLGSAMSGTGYGAGRGGAVVDTSRIEQLLTQVLAVWNAAAQNRPVGPGATAAAARVGA